MPPTPIARASEEIGIESKSVETAIGRVLQVQEVTCHRVLPTRPAPVRFPPRQLKDAVAERTQMLVWRRERDPG